MPSSTLDRFASYYYNSSGGIRDTEINESSEAARRVAAGEVVEVPRGIERRSALNEEGVAELAGFQHLMKVFTGVLPYGEGCIVINNDGMIQNCGDLVLGCTSYTGCILSVTGQVGALRVAVNAKVHPVQRVRLAMEHISRAHAKFSSALNTRTARGFRDRGHVQMREKIAALTAALATLYASMNAYVRNN